jgi:hypothetical protein
MSAFDPFDVIFEIKIHSPAFFIMKGAEYSSSSAASLAQSRDVCDVIQSLSGKNKIGKDTGSEKFLTDLFPYVLPDVRPDQTFISVVFAH